MTVQTTNHEFRVTPNQKLITAKALEAMIQRPIDIDDPRVDMLARTFVVIHLAGMGPYFGRGFCASMNNRHPGDPEQVDREWNFLNLKTDYLQWAINEDTSPAARRLQATKRRIDHERELY